MKVLTRISAHASVCAPARARLLGEGGGVRACGVSRIPGRDSMTEPDTNTEGAGARTAQGGRARSLLSDLTPRTVRLNCGGTRNGSAQSSTAEEPKTGFVPPPFRCARGSRRAELGGSPEFALRPQRRTGGAQPDGRSGRSGCALSPGLSSPQSGCLMTRLVGSSHCGTPWIFQLQERIRFRDSRSAAAAAPRISKVAGKAWRL